MFATHTVIAILIGGLLGIAIPVAVIVIFRLKNRDTWLPSVFIGMGVFVLFAQLLEPLLHLVMLPIVQDKPLWYVVYGALAAGIFEETGRFAAYKTVMKRHYSTKNALFMGLGHGGFEALAIGLSFGLYFIMAIVINNMGGIDAFIETAAKNAPALLENSKAQMDAIAAINFGTVLMALYERIVAMTFHVCMSVWVYKAATEKLWLYPVAIAAHALLDVPAAMYQAKAITSIPVVYAIMTAFTAAVVFVTIKRFKKSR